jgi:hypothetical protein
METETQIMKDVPNSQVDKKVKLLKADPRYVSHQVIDQGNGMSTIEVVLWKE